MWGKLIRQYWNVSIFKETPDNTPYSQLLLALVSFLFLFVLIIQWRFSETKANYSYTIASLVAVSLLLSYYAYTHVLLALNKLSNRTIQTLTSLLMGHLFVHLFAFPLIFLAPFLNDLNPAGMYSFMIGIIYLLITLLLTGWQFMITVYVYKHALNIDYLAATLASFGLLACNILIISLWR